MNGGCSSVLARHRQLINPAWADLLQALGIPVEGLKGEGSWLLADDGAGMLDMVAGLGTAVLGHNPPKLLQALHQALDRRTPMTAPLGLIPECGELAQRLLGIAGHGLAKVHFTSSGAEAVDTALKFAAARTGRRRFVAATGAFHGLSIGATSLAGAGMWRDPFPDMWLPCSWISCGDLDSLEDRLSAGDIAAVIVEPLPGSDSGAGWSGAKLRDLETLCRRFGTMLIVDEVQTGLGRTGRWFAFHEAGPGFRPDLVLLSKALTGGMVPVAAVLMTDVVFAAAQSTSAAKVQGSTLAGNRLAMECGLAVLDVIGSEGLIARVDEAGERLRAGLSELLGPSSGQDLSGRGLLCNFRLGGSAGEANSRFVELIRGGVLISPASHAPEFARLTPPLTISDDEIAIFLDRVEEVLKPSRRAVATS